MDGETGFLFDRAEPGALIGAVQHALDTYGERRRWRAMQAKGMTRDFSWDARARQYADLY